MRTIAIAALVLLACTACAAGPSTRPGVAVEEHVPGRPAAQPGGPAPSSTPSAPPAPRLDAPTRELAWSDCTSDILRSAGISTPPAGISFDCAQFLSPLDPDSSALAVQVDVTRARSARTPVGAAPIVLTTGSQQPSSSALATFAAGDAAGPWLAAHPLLAVDRRGVGGSSALDCLNNSEVAHLTALDHTLADPMARARAVQDAAAKATVDCTDALSPTVLAYDAAHAAGDLEALRRHLGVGSLALLGAGDGATVALAFAAAHPDEVARLVLDAPVPPGADMLTATEQQVRGRQAALDLFADRCTAGDCPLGADPRAAVADLLGRAQRGALGPVTPGSLSVYLSQSLADTLLPWPQRVTTLADTLHRAADGDADAIRTIASTTALDAGQFVDECSDAPPSPTPQRVAQAAAQWSKKYPVFGTDAAFRMLICSAWPSHAVPPVPRTLGVPVVVLSAGADPMVGGGGSDAVVAALTRAGIAVSSITWAGVGHPVVWGSACAADAVRGYLESGAPPESGIACPA